jgi:hypothetical protein
LPSHTIAGFSSAKFALKISASNDRDRAEFPRPHASHVIGEHPFSARSSPSLQPQFSTAAAVQPANLLHGTLHSHFGSAHEI